MIVRDATERDLPAIAALVATLIAEHGLPVPGPARLAASIAQVLRSTTAWYVVAEADDGVVGVLQVNQRYSTWAAASYGYIEDFCVAPAWRGRGVGTLLLAHVERWAHERGWTRLDLDVSVTQRAALRFYQRRGFTATGSAIYRRSLS